MKYTDIAPSGPGPYWVKGSKHPETNKFYEYVVEISWYEGYMLVHQFQNDDVFRIDEFVDAEWAAIPKPEPMEERRAPVQGAPYEHKRGKPGYVAGTISWAEHEEAWRAYHAKYRNDQSAERIAERHGFGYSELCMFLGRAPKTWRPRT